jgi:hypothetical protein
MNVFVLCLFVRLASANGLNLDLEGTLCVFIDGRLFVFFKVYRLQVPVVMCDGFDS